MLRERGFCYAPLCDMHKISNKVKQIVSLSPVRSSLVMHTAAYITTNKPQHWTDEWSLFQKEILKKAFFFYTPPSADFKHFL